MTPVLGPAAFVPSGPHHVAAACGRASVSHASADMQHVDCSERKGCAAHRLLLCRTPLISCRHWHAGSAVGCSAAAAGSGNSDSPCAIWGRHCAVGASARRHHDLCSHKKRRGGFACAPSTVAPSSWQLAHRQRPWGPCNLPDSGCHLVRTGTHEEVCLQVLTWDLRGGRAAAVSFGAGGPSGAALLQRVPLRPLLASLPSLAQQVGPASDSLLFLLA